ncbi:MAG: hypothetical protein KF703_17290, partial [Actinobacteria bacterium]|nr:hypothetical protein [Actinomycetota bacterium]
FCPEDSTPPSTPTALTAKVSGATVALSWGASSDDSGSVAYDIYRNDRIIATQYGTSFTDTPENGATGRLRYTVRAADIRGNRSASPAPVAVNGPSLQIETPIEFGATWRYLDTGSDQGTAWRATAFDDASWPSGPAVLGWGGTQTTTIGATRPTTTYFRRSFTVANAGEVKLLDLQGKFTQGAVVYVNGVEAGRWNMPAGAISASTVASAYVGGAEDNVAKPFAVPGSLLVDGTNTVAVEVHGWRAQSGKVLFDLQATTRGGNGDDAAPTAPTLTATQGPSGVDLAWTPSTDDDAVAGYVLSRDGSPFAIVGSGATTFLDPGPADAAPRSYVVTAFDAGGNRTDSAPTASAPPTTTTTTTTTTVPATTTPTTTPPTTSPPTTTPAAPTVLVPFASTWRWWYQAAAPAGAWSAEGYDDASWARGPGELGFGDTPKGTVISTEPAPRPLTSYYRATVTIADPAAFSAYALSLIRNGGAAVYVNGVEIGRDNLPAGPLTPSTYATAAIPAGQRRVPVALSVPASAFHAGVNTIAVELHLNYRSQPTAGFDLQLTATP